MHWGLSREFKGTWTFRAVMDWEWTHLGNLKAEETAGLWAQGQTEEWWL